MSWPRSRRATSRTPQRKQINLEQFPQNFVVTVGPSTKVRIIHSLFRVNTDPDFDASLTVVGGVYAGVNTVAPFKTITATGQVHTVWSLPGNHFAYPASSIPFAIVDRADQFRDLVGGDDGKEINKLAKLLSSHFIYPHFFKTWNEREREKQAALNTNSSPSMKKRTTWTQMMTTELMTELTSSKPSYGPLLSSVGTQ